jgi:hypothetical protein
MTMKARLAIVIAIAALAVGVLGWPSVGESTPRVTSPDDASSASASAREPAVSSGACELAAAKHGHKATLVTRVVRRDVVVPAASGSIEEGTFRLGEKTVAVQCPRGWTRTGGGVSSEFAGWEASEPIQPNAWRVRFFNGLDSSSGATVSAVCMKVTVRKARA